MSNFDEIFPRFEHWKIEQRYVAKKDIDQKFGKQNIDNQKLENKVIWLILDKSNSQINTINTEVLSELKQILDTISTNKTLFQGLIITSVKQNGFAAGADIQQLKNVNDFDEAFALINQGQMVFQQLSELEIPTLALIHGYCLGGGLEMALACRYRVAILDPKTKLGFPEVLLGVHPGWGGSVRLPRLIGGIKALDIILSGRSFSAKKAAKLRIVDASVPIWDAERASLHYIFKQPPIKHVQGLDKISNWDAVRPLIGNWIRKRLIRKVNAQHYPAPYAVLENWIKYSVNNEDAFLNEAKSIAQLMISSTTQNLVRVFNLQERLKSLHRDKSFKPKQIHVVGAGGIMGGGMAALFALKGFRVTLQDENIKSIAKTFERAHVLFKKSLEEPHRIQAAQDNLVLDINGDDIKSADLIIEAIVEKKEAKQALFKQLERKANKNAILATNTSTIPLEEISKILGDEERIMGMHFFNPVSKMPLVEVVYQEGKEEKPEVGQLCAFARAIDKLPLPVKSGPGFLVNRVLMPYLLESLQLMEEGIPPVAIDNAIVEFGMPQGPIELMDTVGLDVCLHALESLSGNIKSIQKALESSLGNRLRSLVEEGHLGRKTGRGFYKYKKGAPIKGILAADYRIPEDAVDRVILRMINEAIACLREKIVKDADLLDAGLIFGIGFAPFRGGPIHYVLEQGEGLMLQRLNLLVQRYGERFLPDPGWSMLDAV